jgi:hypothetical protein
VKSSSPNTPGAWLFSFVPVITLNIRISYFHTYERERERKYTANVQCNVQYILLFYCTRWDISRLTPLYPKVGYEMAALKMATVAPMSRISCSFTPTTIYCEPGAYDKPFVLTDLCLTLYVGNVLLCDCGFESHRGHGCLSVVCVVCCQVEVSATSWSLVQRSPTDCGASLCVIKKPRGREAIARAGLHSQRKISITVRNLSIKLYRIYVCYTNITLCKGFGIICIFM